MQGMMKRQAPGFKLQEEAIMLAEAEVVDSMAHV